MSAFYRSCFLIAVGLSAVSCNALGQTNTNRGRTVWAAFECMVYAELASRADEQERLFKVGHDAGKSLLIAVEEKSISKREYEQIPIGIKFVLGGPNTDFVLGRIF